MLPGRRERKKLDVRARLLAAALELFVSRGYVATSIDDIAARCDVSRGTVFNHFPRKEDFLVAWIETRRDAARREIASRAELATTARLRAALAAICKLHEQEAPASRALVRGWLQAGGPLLASS